ncbi:hypothetical protein [Burkholderia gladioli]|uniref:Uncharacterized protein n=1 Tax=Burkholderia gladioli (strain BSR3) TaxID=999541 RepID=F2LSD3_BURGS|nr:hypothetical protein [Burkholderia gladioli]AEA65729.1 hypothetical protein bgla_3p0280 [Burkholderia gladioli BSR3]
MCDPFVDGIVIGYIEPKILPVCDALNAIAGVRTLWSCEGHAQRPSRPYIVFESSEAFAFQVHQLLESAMDRGALRYWWRMTANFRPSGRLQWLVEAPTIPSWHYWPIARRKIDAELLALATLFSASQDDPSIPYAVHPLGNSISDMTNEVQ